jgi:hypothetical protein
MIQLLKRLFYYIYQKLVNCYYYIKYKFIKQKYKTTQIERINSLHIKLDNIIPKEDIEAKNLINFIISNKFIIQFICNNPYCCKELREVMYCIFDSYYCSIDCQKNTYYLLHKYWDKL